MAPHRRPSSAGSFSKRNTQMAVLLAALRRKPPVCYRLPECSAKSSRRNRKEVDSSCDIRAPSTISHIGVRVAQAWAELGEQSESYAGEFPTASKLPTMPSMPAASAFSVVARRYRRVLDWLGRANYR